MRSVSVLGLSRNRGEVLLSLRCQHTQHPGNEPPGPALRCGALALTEPLVVLAVGMAARCRVAVRKRFRCGGGVRCAPGRELVR